MSESPAALLARLRRASPLVTRSLVATGVLGAVATIGLVAQAVAIAGAVSTLVAHRLAGVTGYLAWLLGATALRALAVGLSEPVGAALAAPVRRDLRTRALGQLVRRGRTSTVDATVQLITRGIDEVEALLVASVPALVLAALAPATLLVYLAARDWLSGVIVAASALLLPVFMWLLGLAAKDAMDERWRDQQRLASYFGDVVRGMIVLKSVNRSRAAVEGLDAVGASLTDSTMATLRVAFLSSFALELLSSLATALVALTLGLRLVRGSISLDAALVVLLLTPEVFVPLRRAASQYHASSTGVAAATDVLALIERDRSAGTRPAPTSAPRIELIDLVVGARAEPIRARVEPGSLVTVRGPSGVGKSTLAAILARLAEPVSGSVVVDGVDLAEIDADAWHERVGWLAQEPVLRGATIRDAVTQGRHLEDRVVRSMLAALDLDVDLDRPLDEGATLSAGERRRVALAACLVGEPLVLVLDEPTSHLDAASEAAVLAAIDASDATRLIVTHRRVAGDDEIVLSR